MRTTKQTCWKCGHVGNVNVECTSWACAECGLIQRAIHVKTWDETVADTNRRLEVNMTTVVNGRVVTRWSDLWFEVGTLGKTTCNFGEAVAEVTRG